MQTDKLLITALSATTAMTLFSHLVSGYKHKNFSEPEVLGQLIDTLPYPKSKDLTPIKGWCLHYTIGFLFVVSYHELWKRKILKPTLISGVVLGGLSGGAGIIGWKAMFDFHPHPQKKNLNEFFGHLMFAHVIFGIFAALTYKIIVTEKNN